MGGSESSAINYSCWYDYWSVGMINSLEANYWHAAARIRPRIVSIWGENFVLCEKAAKSRFEWELRIQLSQCVVKDTKGRLTMKGCFQCMIIVFVVLRGKWTVISCRMMFTREPWRSRKKYSSSWNIQIYARKLRLSKVCASTRATLLLVIIRQTHFQRMFSWKLKYLRFGQIISFLLR